MTNTIQICNSSDIVKEDIQQKKNSIFTSTSVVDIAKFNNEEVLIKYLLPRKSLVKSDWKSMLKDEIEKINKLQQYEDKLVKVIGFIEEIKFERRNNSFPCIITKYHKHGNLQMFLEKNKDLSWKSRYEISKQITEGIDVLHKNGIYHHDLKITNILIDENKKPLITDYGLSVVNDPCRSNGIYSAPLFLSPIQLEELFLGSKNPTPYNEKDDIYSLSYIFYSLAYLKKPWESEIKDVSDASLICSILFENKRPALKGKILHPDFEKLINNSWDKNASKRPSIDNILQTLTFLLLPEETFKSEVLNKFDSMPSSREMKIKEQELRKEQENNQKEKERKEMQLKAITKQKTETVTVKETEVITTNEKSEKKQEEIKKENSKPELNETKTDIEKKTPMENFEEEKRLTTKKLDEERKNEKLQKEKEAMDRVLKTKKINEEKENQLKLEKSRKEQNEFLRDQEDNARFKIREALLRQLELKKEEEAKRKEKEKEELQKKMEEEAFQKIEKAKNILQEKEKEKLKREQEEARKKHEKEAELKEKWNLQQQKTKELERKKEEERLKREMERMKQIKTEEEENFQKTLKAKEIEEEKIRKRREEELKKSHEQELIIAKQWKLQQEKLREFERQKEENLLKEKKRKEEEEKKKKEEAYNRILIAKKKLEQKEKKPNTSTADDENKNILNFVKNKTDRSAISEFEKKKKELLMEKEKQRQQNIAKDETTVFQKALLAKKKFEEKENQRRKEEQEKREIELRRDREKAEKWKDQKKKFEALEEERRRIREGSVNQDPVLFQYSGRVSPASSVSSRVNFFRQKIDSESEHGSPQFRCQSPSFRSISPLPTSPQLRSSSPQFYRSNSPQLRPSSPTPSNSSITSNSSNVTFSSTSNGQYVYKLRSTNMKDFEKRKMEAQREQERQRRELQKQQEQEAFQKLLNAKKKINEIEAKKKQEEIEKKKLNQSGLKSFGRSRASSTSSTSTIPKEE